MSQYTIGQSSLAHLLFSDKRSAWFWLVIRLYLGYEWLMAGWEKVISPAWVGEKAGAGITGFLGGALKKTAEFCQPAPAPCHPDVRCGTRGLLKMSPYRMLPSSLIWSPTASSWSALRSY